MGGRKTSLRRYCLCTDDKKGLIGWGMGDEGVRKEDRCHGSLGDGFLTPTETSGLRWQRELVDTEARANICELWSVC